MGKQDRAWFALLLLIAMSGLESCSSKDEETAIRELVKKGAMLGEEQDISGFLGLQGTALRWVYEGMRFSGDLDFVTVLKGIASLLS